MSAAEQITTPGIYEMPAEAYHADPCPTPSLSRSIAHKLLHRSPEHAHYAHPRLGGNGGIRPTRAMDDGSAVHSLILGNGPQIRPITAIYGPKHERAGEVVTDFKTAAAQEEKEALRAAGHIPVLQHRIPHLNECAEAVKAKLRVHQDGGPFFAPGKAEAVVAWREGDIWLRIMVDWLPDDPKLPPCDLKLTELAAAPGGWERRLQTEYAFQCAFYRRGLKAVRGVDPGPMLFGVGELDAPHGTTIQAAAPELQEIAAEQVEDAITLWRECLKANKWPGYPPYTSWVEPTSWQRAAHDARQARDKFMRDRPSPELFAQVQQASIEAGAPWA